ncbi:MAG: 3-phosphoshikimate 1-carboxyvinyltransferase [Pyrinomonadaceae bacterium]|nr:3-phosphoshikimate 1-carboxyvinyltransferase [Pyrinomonadaceae bacterium]
MKIQPVRRIRESVRLPGDKSISHRAAIISALASRGRSRITNFSTSEDCAATLACFKQLGVIVEQDGTTVIVEAGGPILSEPRVELDCGNSGSTMRMLSGVLAGQPFASTLTGDASLRSRPMKRVIAPLEMMGARVSSRDGRAPLQITGRRPLQSLDYELPVASAQVKSAILLAGLSASGRTNVTETLAPTRDHTERMLQWFGVPIETKRGDGSSPNVVSIEGPATYQARDYEVPGDISSAAFFIAAAALLPGSNLLISDVGLNPTRAQVIASMQKLSADVRVLDMRVVCNEDVGDIQISGAESLVPKGGGHTNTLRGTEVAQLIDELPMLAVVGSQVDGGLEIRDARELRVKESDRISTTVENLRLMGAEVEEYEDGLKVAGRTRLRGAKLNAHGDHRIAMAFTVAALVAEGESEIIGAECVAVSFPGFFSLLESVIER